MRLAPPHELLPVPAAAATPPNAKIRRVGRSPKTQEEQRRGEGISPRPPPRGGEQQRGEGEGEEESEG